MWRTTGYVKVAANLELALAGLSTLLKDVKDEGGAITQPGGAVSQGLGKVLQLPGG